jgi:hypothetical protein
MIIIQPSASRTSSLFRPIPAINRWAIFNRPLKRGLGGTDFFGQNREEERVIVDDENKESKSCAGQRKDNY